MPGWFVWGLAGLWVVKDIALFPFVWSAYDKGSAEATRSMIGARGLARVHCPLPAIYECKASYGGPS